MRGIAIGRWRRSAPPRALSFRRTDADGRRVDRGLIVPGSMEIATRSRAGWVPCG